MEPTPITPPLTPTGVRERMASPTGAGAAHALELRGKSAGRRSGRGDGRLLVPVLFLHDDDQGGS